MVYQFVWLFLIALLGVRLFYPATDTDLRVVTTWLDAVTTLLLLAYVFFTALGIGRRFQSLLQELSKLELYLFSLILGLAVLSTGILILGLIGAINPLMIFLWLALCGLSSSFQWQEVIVDIRGKWQAFKWFRFNDFNIFENILFMVAGLMGVVLLMVSLAPVRDYDALMYHLQIPRQFLEHGRVYFDPGEWRLSQPMLTEMLFLIGITFHLDPFAQLISLTFCIVFFLSVYAFGKRFFDSAIGVLAVGILLGYPAFPIYATSPSVEFSWAVYEFWGMYLFSIWLFLDKKKAHQYWLVFAGILFGCAATVKYLSFPTLFIMGLIVFGKTLHLEKGDFKKAMKNVLMFGISALVVISPWYLKNWVWTGNPFYPLIFGGPGWTALRQQLIFDDYVASFGAGTTWLDYLKMPLDMYLATSRFSTVSLEVFHPLLWLGFAFALSTKWKKYNYLFIYVVLVFILWATSMRQIRFLLPVSGFLALLSAYSIAQFPRMLKQVISVACLGGLMFVTMIYQVIDVHESGLLSYFVGKSSRIEFLQKGVYNYRTTQFIQNNLEKTDRVLFLWSGHGYYCDERCLPDGDQSLAIQLTINSPMPEVLARQLHLNGITHILVGRPDVYWFISYHDPKHLHRIALNYFDEIFIPACANLLYSDGPLGVYELTCK